jgi:hypothetical protein
LMPVTAIHPRTISGHVVRQKCRGCGQTIGFCRLPSAVNGRPQQAMACPTSRLVMSLDFCALG